MICNVTLNVPFGIAAEVCVTGSYNPSNCVEGNYNGEKLCVTGSYEPNGGGCDCGCHDCNNHSHDCHRGRKFIRPRITYCGNGKGNW